MCTISAVTASRSFKDAKRTTWTFKKVVTECLADTCSEVVVGVAKGRDLDSVGEVICGRKNDRGDPELPCLADDEPNLSTAELGDSGDVGHFLLPISGAVMQETDAGCILEWQLDEVANDHAHGRHGFVLLVVVHRSNKRGQSARKKYQPLLVGRQRDKIKDVCSDEGACERLHGQLWSRDRIQGLLRWHKHDVVQATRHNDRDCREGVPPVQHLVELDAKPFAADLCPEGRLCFLVFQFSSERNAGLHGRQCRAEPALSLGGS